MSHRTFVVPRTLTLTGKPVIYFAATLAVAAGALAPTSARAESASVIYKKMTDVYSNAKSYQGTIIRIEKGKTKDGKPASKTVTVRISFKAPNKYNVSNTTSVTAQGKTQSTGQTMVTDGKVLFMYSADKKLYQHGQIPNENMLSRFFALLPAANGFMLQPDTNLDGHPVYDLRPNIPAKGTAAEIAATKNVKIDILIDKKTYQFMKMTISSPNGSLIQTVNGQSVNGSVADSAFSWTPPAGYKEFKPQSAPGGGPTIPGSIPGRAPGQ